MINIRHSLAAFILIATALCIPSIADDEASTKEKETDKKFTSLLKENTLDGWGYFLVKKEGSDEMPKMSDVWSIDKGVLTCQGVPMGYLATNEKYTNFVLTFQWRWPKDVEPTNSGVFVRVTGKDQALPKCVEVQLCHKKAGDLIAFHGLTLSVPKKGSTDRLVKKESPVGGAVSILTRTQDAELPPGDWNQGKVIVNGKTIMVFMNNKLVNYATDLPVIAGKIALQSEGGPIEFKAVKIIKL